MEVFVFPVALMGCSSHRVMGWPGKYPPLSPVTYICFSQVVTGLRNSDVGIIFSLSLLHHSEKGERESGLSEPLVSALQNGEGYHQLFSNRRLFRIFRGRAGERVSAEVTLQICIREVPVRISARTPAVQTQRGFAVFLSTAEKVPGFYRYRILPNSFYFILSSSPL